MSPRKRQRSGGGAKPGDGEEKPLPKGLPMPELTPEMLERKEQTRRDITANDLSEILTRFREDRNPQNPTYQKWVGDFFTSFILVTYDGYDRAKEVLAAASAFKPGKKQRVPLPAEGINLGQPPGQIQNKMQIVLSHAQYEALKRYVNHRIKELSGPSGHGH